MRRFALLAGLLLLTAGGLYLAARFNAGFREFGRFQDAPAGGAEDDAVFARREAEIARARRLYANPDFDREAGRFYRDRAIVEDRRGDPSGRDARLDQAAAAFAECVRRNPADSWAYFELGRVYMLYNSPLLTYADRGRAYLRLALELNPAHEHLNLIALYFHLTQWDMLEEPEKRFVWARLESKWREKPAFIHALRRLWRRAAKSEGGLREILKSNPTLWALLGKEF